MAASLEERERLYKDIEARLGSQHGAQDERVQELESQLAHLSAEVQEVHALQLKYRCVFVCVCLAFLIELGRAYLIYEHLRWITALIALPALTHLRTHTLVLTHFSRSHTAGRCRRRTASSTT